MSLLTLVMAMLVVLCFYDFSGCVFTLFTTLQLHGCLCAFMITTGHCGLVKQVTLSDAWQGNFICNTFYNIETFVYGLLFNKQGTFE